MFKLKFLCRKKTACQNNLAKQSRSLALFSAANKHARHCQSAGPKEPHACSPLKHTRQTSESTYRARRPEVTAKASILLAPFAKGLHDKRSKFPKIRAVLHSLDHIAFVKPLLKPLRFKSLSLTTAILSDQSLEKPLAYIHIFLYSLILLFKYIYSSLTVWCLQNNS